MLQIAFPSLFQSDDFLDLLGEARLPKLDLLLSRGKREPLGSASLEARLCQALGIARQQDWPLAPVTLAQAGGQPGNDYWLRADPVHVHIERNRLLLSEVADLSVEEAHMLCDALAAHFGEAFSPQALRPGAWVVRIPGNPDITTTPLSLAAGQAIEPLLPGGGKALQWRRLLNEAQMLLFNHPLNQAREARGESAINSVWLWGGGCLPEKGRPTGRTVLCDHADWRALAEYAGAKVSVLPAGWSPDVPDDALIVFDEPHRRLRQGDLSGWLQAMQGFETNWLRPLLASGRSFRLDDPLPGLSLSWRGAYRWKFWRRPKKPQRPSFDMQPPGANANTASGVDQFGNRF